ncbi:hypothetical protein Lal_00038137 [Lupinus albus]|nr:hypothetical protein Lal_00038137 [Lupinus albus]
MTRQLNIPMLFLATMLLLLLVENHAGIGVTSNEAPAPSPQSSINGTHFPMYGITEGSLQPQGIEDENNVVHVAQRDAQTHSTRSHVCSFAKSVVPNACVCLLELMATSKSVHATITGRLKREVPNAPETSNFFNQVSC